MRAAVHGYGAMGRLVAEKLKINTNIVFLGAVDENININNENNYDNNCYKSFHDLPEKPDVIIDFSHFSKLESLVDYCERTGTALFVATTGHTQKQKNNACEKASKFPLIMATNTSLGVNIMNELMSVIVPILEDWDIEVIEKHHNKKIDSPSGTAATLLEKINQALENKKVYKYGREGIAKREKNEIGVHSLRGGTIVGEHSAIFAGEDEVIEIKHEAHSKSIFAVGAVKGAIWLHKKPPGVYTMKDVLFG